MHIGCATEHGVDCMCGTSGKPPWATGRGATDTPTAVEHGGLCSLSTDFNGGRLLPSWIYVCVCEDRPDVDNEDTENGCVRDKGILF